MVLGCSLYNKYLLLTSVFLMYNIFLCPSHSLEVTHFSFSGQVSCEQPQSAFYQSFNVRCVGCLIHPDSLSASYAAPDLIHRPCINTDHNINMKLTKTCTNCLLASQIQTPANHQRVPTYSLCHFGCFDLLCPKYFLKEAS